VAEGAGARRYRHRERRGEQFREHFVHGFLEHVDGIDWQRMTTMGIRDNRYTVDLPTVTGLVARKRSVCSRAPSIAISRARRQCGFVWRRRVNRKSTSEPEHKPARGRGVATKLQRLPGPWGPQCLETR